MISKKIIKEIFFLLTFFSISFFALHSLAYVMSSPNYQILKDSINVGGLPENSTNYKMWETIGEEGTGKLSSSNYSLIAGYQNYIPSAAPTLSFSISGASLDLGVLTPGNVATAGPSTFTVSTNASNGVVVMIKDANDGLSTGSYTIPAKASSNLGTEGYGVYGANASGGLQVDEGFDNDGASDVAISTSFQAFASSSSSVDTASVDLYVKAIISGTTGAGSYSDTITVIATGRF